MSGLFKILLIFFLMLIASCAHRDGVYVWEPRECTIGAGHTVVERGKVELKLQRYSKCFDEEEALVISWKGRSSGALRTTASFLARQYADGHLFHSTAAYAGEMIIDKRNMMIYTLSPSHYAIRLQEKKKKEINASDVVIPVVFTFIAAITIISITQ